MPSFETSDEERLIMDFPIMSQDIIAAAAAAAGVVVKPRDTPGVLVNPPPVHDEARERIPSAVSSSTDLLDDVEWDSEPEEMMESVQDAVVRPTAHPVAVVVDDNYVDFSQEDENRLISLATEQAPAWRLRRNCTQWARIFPGRDPEVVKRRYALILKSWGAFKTMNDLVMCRDGRVVQGHTFSSTTHQALSRFNAHGIDE